MKPRIDGVGAEDETLAQQALHRMGVYVHSEECDMDDDCTCTETCACGDPDCTGCTWS